MKLIKVENTKYLLWKPSIQRKSTDNDQWKKLTKNPECVFMINNFNIKYIYDKEKEWHATIEGNPSKNPCIYKEHQ